MVDTDNKSIRSRTAFKRLTDRESNYIFVKEMSCYAYMDHRSTSFQGKSVNVDFFSTHRNMTMRLTMNLRLIANLKGGRRFASRCFGNSNAQNDWLNLETGMDWPPIQQRLHSWYELDPIWRPINPKIQSQ